MHTSSSRNEYNYTENNKNEKSELLTKLLFTENNDDSADPSLLNSPEKDAHTMQSTESHKLSIFSMVN